MERINFKTFQELNFDYRSLSCIDLPIAYASSYYDAVNFYCYCLIVCIIENWKCIPTKSFSESKNYILKQIDLKIYSKEIYSRNEFFTSIWYCIDKRKPVFIALDYYYMFYARNDLYLNEHIAHGTLITAYDKEKSLILVQDGSHMEFKGLFALQLTESILYDIWDKSKNFFIENNNFFKNSIFIIDKLGENKNITPLEILNNYLSDDCLIKYDNLIFLLEHFDDYFVDLSYYKSQIRLRRVFYTSIELFFYIIELIPAKGYIEKYFSDFYSFKDQYLRFRDFVVSYMIKNAIKKITLEKNKVNEIVESLNNFNKKLNDFIIKFTNSSELYKINGMNLGASP